MGDQEDVRALARELPVLGSVGRVVRRAVRRRFPLSPLTDAQVGLLRTVEADEGVASGAVAARLQLAPSTVSTLVRELVDEGLVRREVDPGDRRASRLSLTPEARERLRLWGEVRDEVLGEALARLDDADRAALTAALPAVRRLVAALDPHVASASGTTTGQPATGSGTTTASTP